MDRIENIKHVIDYLLAGKYSGQHKASFLHSVCTVLAPSK